MKNEPRYYQFKWLAFFLVILIIGFTVAGYLSTRNPSAEEPLPEAKNPTPGANDQFISSQSFSQLIDASMKELELLENISFEGENNGHFSIHATVADLSNLYAIANETKPYKAILNTFEGRNVSINGHLSKNDQGNGTFTIDTITYSGQKIPATAITPYIEKYTSLNDLVDAPYEEITITPDGISFLSQVPAFIQTVFDNQDPARALHPE